MRLQKKFYLNKYYILMKKTLFYTLLLLIISWICNYTYADNDTVIICAEIAKDPLKRVTNLYIEPELPNSSDNYNRISDTCIWLNYTYRIENNSVIPYFLTIKVRDYDMIKNVLLDTYTIALWHEWISRDGQPYKKTLRYEIIDATFENDIKTVWSVMSVIDSGFGITSEAGYLGFSIIPPVIMNEYINILYQIGATKYDSNVNFKPEWFITREQAAKFFVATREKYNEPNSELWWWEKKECIFSNENIDNTLKDYVYTACVLGIMKWSQEKFYPKQQLTLGQAVTVLTRITDWELYEPKSDLWFKTYFTLAWRNNLFAGWNRTPYLLEWKQRVSRGEMAIMINNVLKNK